MKPVPLRVATMPFPLHPALPFGRVNRRGRNFTRPSRRATFSMNATVSTMALSLNPLPWS